MLHQTYRSGLGMLSLSSSGRYFLYRHPADMRKGFDGLSGLVREGLQKIR